MVASTDELEQKYLTLVARIRGYRLPKAAEAQVFAEIEERAAREAAVPGGSTTSAG